MRVAVTNQKASVSVPVDASAVRGGASSDWTTTDMTYALIDAALIAIAVAFVLVIVAAAWMGRGHKYD